MVIFAYIKKDGGTYYFNEVQLFFDNIKSALKSAQEFLFNIKKLSTPLVLEETTKADHGEYLLYLGKNDGLIMYEIKPDDPAQIEACQLLRLIARNTEITSIEAMKKQNERHREVLSSLGYYIKNLDEVSNKPRISPPELMKKGKPKQSGPFKATSYPFLVLRTLENANNTPLTQNEIKSAIIEKYQTSIPRETIGKQLKILEEYGYPIKHEKQKDGYWLENAN